MKSAIFTAILLAAGSAYAQMPPDTYAGPLGDRLVAAFRCVGTSISDGGVTLPAAFNSARALRPGEYRNPTTCARAGAPSGPQF